MTSNETLVNLEIIGNVDVLRNFVFYSGQVLVVGFFVLFCFVFSLETAEMMM